MSKHKNTIIAVLLVVVAILAYMILSGDGKSIIGGDNLSEGQIESNILRVFPGARNIQVSRLSQCSDNPDAYEASVRYELYDPLYNRYTVFDEWYLFWSPYDENSFYRGRCK